MGVLRAWLEEFERTLRARIEAADPIDPGIPLPAEPGRRRPPVAGVRAARGEALPPRGDCVPRLARGRGRRARAGAAEAGSRVTKVDDDDSPASSSRRGGSCGSGPLTRSGPRRTSAPATCSSRSARRRRDRAWRAFAISSGSGDVTRSSCSSASIRTASHGVSATAGFCAVAPRLRSDSVLCRAVGHDEPVRRVFALALVLVALVASPAAAAVVPGALVLRQADLPDGFRPVPGQSGVRSNARRERDYPPALRPDFERFRRVTGYQAQFARSRPGATIVTAAGSSAGQRTRKPSSTGPCNGPRGKRRRSRSATRVGSPKRRSRVVGRS